jgi:hypothetical protein
LPVYQLVRHCFLLFRADNRLVSNVVVHAV